MFGFQVAKIVREYAYNEAKLPSIETQSANL